VVSDAYRGFTPASMAGNGGYEEIRAIPIFYISQYVIFFSLSNVMQIVMQIYCLNLHLN
jgi:hypothetical protein